MRSIAVVMVTLSLLMCGGCDYQLRGRVLDTGFDSAQLVPVGDERLEQGSPVTGARIVLIRDPGSLKMSEVATAVSSSNGHFTIRPGEFGSGWMDEQWSIRISRQGYGGVEELITLPFDPKKSELLVTLARGAPRSQPRAPQGDDLSDESKRYWSHPGGR